MAIVRRTVQIAFGVLMAAAFLAACGGGFSGPKNRTKRSIAACFNKSTQAQNIRVTDAAQTPSNDTVHNPENVMLVEIGVSPGGDPDNQVLIDAEPDSSSADAVERDFKSSASGAEEVDRKGNVIEGWVKKPTDSEKGQIRECV